MWHITTYDERYAIAPDASQHILLVPGWSTDRQIFEWIVPALAQHFVVHLANYPRINASDNCTTLASGLQLAMQEKNLQKAFVIGWSLGGNIALALAQNHPEKVLALQLISTSPCFTQKPNWPNAMAEDTLGGFIKLLQKSPEKTLKRFDALQAQGDACEKALLKSLRDYRGQQNAWDNASLLQGLKLLQNVDQQQLVENLQQETLWVFGENDALLGEQNPSQIAALNPRASLQVLESCAHLPFVTDSQAFFEALVAFAKHSFRKEQKRRVAESFSKAAPRYDKAAIVQQDIAQQLLQMAQGEQFNLLLDAGCGTGFSLQALSEQAQTVLAVDCAVGMLQQAKTKCPNAVMLLADIENLPLQKESLDAVFSSLAVQWSDDLAALLGHWYRLLKPGGKIYVATLLDGSLKEIKQSFAEVDQNTHVNNFLTEKAVIDLLNDLPFSKTCLQTKHYTLAYPDVASVLKSLKAIGAQQVLGRKTQGLMGKKRFAALNIAYQKFAGENVAKDMLPLSYHAAFLVLEK